MQILILFFFTYSFAYSQDFASPDTLIPTEFISIRTDTFSYPSKDSINGRIEDALSQKVYFLNSFGNFSKVLFKGRKTFVETYTIKKTPSIVNVIAKNEVKEWERNRRIYEENRKKEEAKRKEFIIKKFGKKNGQKILERKIWIGITEEMAEYSWGKPDTKNNTVTAYSNRSQWVYEYDNSYLYFENGKLVSWQTSE